MDISGPSNDQWPALTASHESMKQPQLHVPIGGGHAGVEPPRRFASPTNPGGLGRPHGVTSFASMVSKPVCSHRFPEVQLAARQYGFKEGVPSVPFSATEYLALTQKFKHTLIAKFQVGRPPLESVKQFMLSKWKIEGRVTITNNWDDRHIVVLLDSEKDVQSALTYPWRKVGHTMFRLFRWTSDYDPKKESTKITKWIRLPGLPMEFFDRQAIKSLVSSFANFLDIDTRTKEVASLSYARACVELDVTKDLPIKVWVNLPGDRGFFQDVVIEGNITYCQRCRLHGHDAGTCRKLAKAQTKKDTVQTEGETSINIAGKIDMTDPFKEQEWQVVNRKKKGKGIMEDGVQPSKDQDDNGVAEQASLPTQLDKGINAKKDKKCAQSAQHLHQALSSSQSNPAATCLDHNAQGVLIIEGVTNGKIGPSEKEGAVPGGFKGAIITEEKEVVGTYNQSEQINDGEDVPSLAVVVYNDHRLAEVEPPKTATGDNAGDDVMIILEGEDGRLSCKEFGDKTFQDIKDLIIYANDKGIVLDERVLPTEEPAKDAEALGTNEDCDQNRSRTRSKKKKKGLGPQLVRVPN